VENCQVAVFLSYASPAGHALIDRELYLPKSWVADAARCAAAGIPEGTGFATKPKLARAMIARALDAGIPAAWVTGDEVYGADPGLRADLEARRTGYVLAVAATRQVATRAGTCPARQIAARLPRAAWQRYSAGEGMTGLDEHQVRRWNSWYRWITLAMLALAFLTIAATEHTRHPAPAGQIPLTRNEIVGLFAALIIQPAHDARLRWSAWRRRCQHRAKTCHYQRQTRQP
jgi:SRSO17 transposase